jgi:predicted N-formylglutamate amidohydrolase
MHPVTGRAAAGLLLAEEPAAVEVVNLDGAGTAVLLCDHASNRVPQRLGTLGLDARQLAEHIAWDPGAAEVARRLSAQLNAPLVLSGYSRLVVDCNRPLGHPDSMAESSAGVPVPGNRGLTPEDRALRVDGLFRPYHEAIARLLDRRSGRPALLLSIHSFTAVLNGRARPWHLGISHGKDRRLAALLLDAFPAGRDLRLGDNEPYPIEDSIDYTIPWHGDGRGLPSVMIEIRQDGIRGADDAAAWAARLAEAYRRVEGPARGLCGP